MNYNFDDDKPIYKQLMHQIKVEIVSGIYLTGDRLPSVRELAVQTRVNPNTIQRALIELENEGLIITKRTSGKFVTEDQKIIDSTKTSLANDIMDKFIVEMESLNLTKKDIIQYIKNKE